MMLSYLERFLDEYLLFDQKMDVGRIDPYMSNGMMVKGSIEVKRIGFGVSASLSLFEKAVQEKCDAIVVHHSFNLPAYNRYDAIFQKRMQFLLTHNVSLFGYHFLLDAHPKVGNNVQILRAIEATPIEPYVFHGAPWGWVGEIQRPVTYDTLFSQIQSLLSPSCISYPTGPALVKRVIALSGKGAPSGNGMQDLLDRNIDLYITGEAHEWNRELFAEAGIHFLAGGHYHTEVFGVKALMNHVCEHVSDVDAVWLDLPNDV